MTTKLPWQDWTDSRGPERAERVRRFARLTGLKPSDAGERPFAPHCRHDLTRAGDDGPCAKGGIYAGVS